MTDKQAEELALVLDKRGYLVIASSKRYDIGHVITGFMHSTVVSHPVVVIAITDEADFAQQCLMIDAEFYSDYRDYYYRCTTD